MQLSKGVEWACHAAALMSAMPEGRTLRAEALAKYHGVPAAYMAKQLQAMSKAGLVHSARGAKGGYRLAVSPANINLWDITQAIEGSKPAFRCSEIRQNGPCPARKEACDTPCPIAASFQIAETAYRDALRNISLIDIGVKVLDGKTPEEMARVMAWILEHSAHQ